jgi:hypothetical protein
MGDQNYFCRRLYTGTFSPWFASIFERDFKQFLNHDRMQVAVGPAEYRGGIDMDCPICRSLEQGYEAGLSEYVSARSSVCFRLSTKFAAQKNVDMERAKYALEEHQLQCDSAIKLLALLPKRDVPKGLMVGAPPVFLPRLSQRHVGVHHL